MWTSYNKIEKEKHFIKKKGPLFKKIVLGSEYYYFCVNVLLFILFCELISLKLSSDQA